MLLMHAWLQAEVYRAGFYDGVFIVGPHAGKRVELVKTEIQSQIIAEKQAFKYQEPEKQVHIPFVSRSSYSLLHASMKVS